MCTAENPEWINVIFVVLIETFFERLKEE